MSNINVDNNTLFIDSIRGAVSPATVNLSVTPEINFTPLLAPENIIMISGMVVIVTMMTLVTAEIMMMIMPLMMMVIEIMMVLVIIMMMTLTSTWLKSKVLMRLRLSG